MRIGCPWFRSCLGHCSFSACGTMFTWLAIWLWSSFNSWVGGKIHSLLSFSLHLWHMHICILAHAKGGKKYLRCKEWWQIHSESCEGRDVQTMDVDRRWGQYLAGLMLQESTQSGPGGGIQYEFVISLRCYIIEDSYNTNFICPCEQPWSLQS